MGRLTGIRLIDDSNEEWSVDIEAIRLAVTKAIRDVAQSPEHVEVSQVEVIGRPHDVLHINVTLSTSVAILSAEPDEKTKAALNRG